MHSYRLTLARDWDRNLDQANEHPCGYRRLDMNSICSISPSRRKDAVQQLHS